MAEKPGADLNRNSKRETKYDAEGNMDAYIAATQRRYDAEGNMDAYIAATQRILYI